MSDDFIKQLQENAVDKVVYESQQEEIANKQRKEFLKLKEKCRTDLYKDIIEQTKAACLEAVKQGDYVIDEKGKKLVGVLEFYSAHSDYDYATDYFGIRCIINGKAYFNISDYSSTVRELLSEQDILFIIWKTMEVDCSNIFDKIRNKKKIAHPLKPIKDSKSIQIFTDLFQSSISNSKIIGVSEIPLWNYNSSMSAKRKFNFEIVF